MLITLAIVVIANVLEIATAIRVDSYKIGWLSLALLYSIIAVWASSLKKEEKALEAK